MAQKRNQTSQVNIRMTTEERGRLERAIKLLVPGVRVPMGPWILHEALASADRILEQEEVEREARKAVADEVRTKLGRDSIDEENARKKRSTRVRRE